TPRWRWTGVSGLRPRYPESVVPYEQIMVQLKKKPAVPQSGGHHLQVISDNDVPNRLRVGQYMHSLSRLDFPLLYGQRILSFFVHAPDPDSVSEWMILARK